MNTSKNQSRSIDEALAPLNQFLFNLEFLVRSRECEEALMPSDGWGTDAEAIVLNELYKLQETIFPTREELGALPSWKKILKGSSIKSDARTL
ncbi:MAG: hypothetical protein HUU46_07615 [Candidatus Hydrogenedentes bacterium]|nr:hypothetical protein [Candidatus Hydrogenedentota bacterium]